MLASMENELDAVANTRRDFLKKSAIVGGTAAWSAPLVSGIVAPAMADGSEACSCDGDYNFKITANRVGADTTVRIEIQNQTRNGLPMLRCSCDDRPFGPLVLTVFNGGDTVEAICGSGVYPVGTPAKGTTSVIPLSVAPAMFGSGDAYVASYVIHRSSGSHIANIFVKLAQPCEGDNPDSCAATACATFAV